jgi:guanylate kinase
MTKQVASSDDKNASNRNSLRKDDIIVAIIGKSGSGKSEIVKKYYNEGFNVIQSYTDRPERFPNEWGHIFIQTEEVEKYREDMIAYTFFHRYHYFATRSQYRGRGITFYVIDPKGVTELKEKVVDADLKFIYICVDEDIRIERMVKRSLDKLHNSIEKDVQVLYDAARDRAGYDRNAFKVVECDYVVDNNGTLKDTFLTIDRILENL